MLLKALVFQIVVCKYRMSEGIPKIGITDSNRSNPRVVMPILALFPLLLSGSLSIPKSSLYPEIDDPSLSVKLDTS